MAELTAESESPMNWKTSGDGTYGRRSAPYDEDASLVSYTLGSWVVRLDVPDLLLSIPGSLYYSAILPH